MGLRVYTAYHHVKHNEYLRGFPGNDADFTAKVLDRLADRAKFMRRFQWFN